MNRQMHGFVWIALLSGVLISGCTPAGEQSAPVLKREGTEPIQIVCTTGMVADLVRHVGGEEVEVIQLLGEGTDPHTYTGSPQTTSQLKDAQMIFYSGVHLEGKWTSELESLSQRIPTFAVVDHVARWENERLLKVDGDEVDPHVWFDVDLWRATLPLIADRLADYDPDNAELYVKNAQEYSEKLLALHEECKTAFAKIPEKQRVLVTAHDAFQYFGKAYGVTVKAVQGVSTATEASIKHIEELVDYIVTNKIKAVFVETSVSEKAITQLIEGCKSKGHTLAEGGSLYSDSMGKEGTPEGTYEGMIRHNMKTIVKALK